ncbi:MAG: helix-turn-helix domain-containing protein [Pseudomonadota bacterium]
MARKGRERGTDNVLADLGFEDAEELTAKATLALKVNRILTEREFTQVEAAKRLGMPQSKISQIRNYKLQNISLERLMQALVALDQRVEVVVRASRRREDSTIAVVI